MNIGSKNDFPNADEAFACGHKTMCFIKNVITAPNIFVGDYTYYDSADDPAGFEKNNVLFNWPEFGDKLIIGKFCSIAHGTQFIMGSANHRVSSVTLIRLMCSAENGRKTHRRTFRSCRLKATLLLAMTFGLGANALLCPG